MQNITILGSTGSIGLNTLDVIARHPDRFKVVALTAGNKVELLFEQCRRFAPVYAVLRDENGAEQLQTLVNKAGLATQVLQGVAALEKVATLPDVNGVMAAIVGAAGLRPTLAAAKAGKRVMLANKEALVMSGSLFMEAVRHNHATLLPVDSEHNAIFQSLPRNFSGDLVAVGVKRILLTASGGPFCSTPLSELEHITPDQACAHPNWVMGRKISVDSATMMNKGLEVIEAHWLFNALENQIQVVIHQQSVIHSLVEYVDGSVIAQLGNPDMRTPIAYALAYPERIEAGVQSLDLFKIGTLNFEAPDLNRFPCLRLAYQALQRGEAAPTILNAANEVAVANFLAERMPYKHIPLLIEAVLDKMTVKSIGCLDDVLEADRMARTFADEWLAASRPGFAARAAR
ncbi:MAG TPA: 1-deoxy-D-xylulose-5-phosphate reductoisomerase [Burkholderiales bacterium]|nr:1-deoxy-D-xylulose-5-phosphate reductoisomerase [Burkholderiales bacterium]